MKRYLFLFILLFCGVVANAEGVVTIKGLIQNPSSDSIRISYNNNRLIYDPIEYKALLDEGKFEYSFKLKDDYTTIAIIHGNLATELLVSPGDDLELTAQVKDTTWDLTYKGMGSERANFIAKHAINMGYIDGYPAKMQKSLNDDVKTFIKNVNADEEAEYAYLEKNKKGLSPQFVRYLQQTYRYFTYFGLFQYPLMHEVMKNRGYNFSHIPPENYDAVKAVPPSFNDSFINSTAYRLFADQYYRMQLEVAGFYNDSLHVYRMQDSVAKLAIKNMPPATAEYVVALHLYSSMRTIPLSMITERLEQYKKRWPNSIYKKDLEAQYAIAKRLAPGEKAFDFTFTTAQGKTAKLSDFKGKVVLLGFWSTEDRRSMVELNAGSKMAKHYEDKDITFLYVSLDKEDAPWIKTIEKYKFKGVHTREDGVWKSLVAQMYGVQGLPAFYLIDKEGKFVVQQTPFPGQTTTIAPIVDKLLGIPPSLPAQTPPPGK